MVEWMDWMDGWMDGDGGLASAALNDRRERERERERLRVGGSRAVGIGEISL